MIAFARTAGQSNYASGCTFKDAFALSLAQDALTQAQTKIRVINWGYWGSTGIVASDAYRDRMAFSGIGSIEAPEAMQVLEELLSSPIPQVALMKTIRRVDVHCMNKDERVTVYPPVPSVGKHLQDKVERPVLSHLEDALKKKGDLERSERKEMNQILHLLLLGQLQILDCFKTPNQSITDLQRTIGLSEKYYSWFNETLAFLTRNKMIEHNGSSYTNKKKTLVDLDLLWKDWDKKKRFGQTKKSRIVHA